MTTRGLYTHAAEGLSPACSGSGVDAQRDSHRLTAGNGGERTGRSRERRNRCGGLKQARGPRRYSRASSLLAPSPVGLLRRFPADRQGQGRRLAARVLRDCLAVGRLGGRWRRYRVMGSWCGRNQLIPFHLVGAIKCAGRIRTLSSIHPHPTSERTRAGPDSSCSRYEFTASTLSSIHRYSLPSTTRRTSSNTRSAGLSSGL